MEKKTKRKAFNFLRSYFDVINELDNDTDKFNFLISIINKQFLDEDPKDLNFIVNLCYRSQKHSIESSVNGWKRVNKTDVLGNPMTHPPTNPTTHPSTNPQEEEEEEKEEEKEQLLSKAQEINNSNFLNECLNSSQWSETTAMQLKISTETIKLFLNHFIDHLITMQEQKKNSKEFKQHFVYWLKKQNLSQFRKKIIGKTNQV